MTTSALAQMRAGRFGEAAAAWRQVLAGAPEHWEAHGYLADCLLRLRDLAGAEAHAARSAALRSPNPGAWVLLAQIAIARDDLGGAERALRRALEAGRRTPDTYRALAKVLRGRGDYVQAGVAAREGLALAPDDADLHVKAAINLGALGRSEEGVAACEAGLARAPGARALLQARATILNCVPGVSAAEVASAHRAFGASLGGAGPRPSPAACTGVLRVALVSPDLHRHSVAFFLPAILRHAPDHGLRVFCYSTNPYADGETARLRALAGAGRWRDVGQEPGALAHAAREDSIDVAVDLSGLSRDHRLAEFAARIAPRQVTFLGYPATTGVPAMDARLVDSLTDPAGSEAHAVERLVRIDPCFLCYRPPEGAPAVAPRPPGPVTFGSFNTLRKLNGFTLALWSRVLAASPGSRLLIKSRGLEFEGVRADLGGRLEAAGVPRERFELRGFVGNDAEHLGAYAEVDVALDPYPYHGTTTTLEAVLMGVPVVTLAGDRHAARVGVSLLTNLGRPEWCAADGAGYVRIAAELAGDAPGRAALRRGLRGALQASAIFDGPGYAERFARAVRGVAELPAG